MVIEIAWLIFIRANSSRFPGKCYTTFDNRNILGHLSDSLSRSLISPSNIFLCTSDQPENHAIIQQARSLSFGVLIGSEEYPLQRITCNWQALESFRYIVRVCGDSPLYSFRFANKCAHFYDSSDVAAITNTRLRNFPSGFSVEIYNRCFLQKFFAENPSLACKEHMSSLLAHPNFDSQRIRDIKPSTPLDFFASNRYTVDWPEDCIFIEDCLKKDLQSFYEESLCRLQLII